MLTKNLYDEHGEWMGSIEDQHYGSYIARVLVDSYLDDVFEERFGTIEECEKYIKENYLRMG